MNAAFISQTMNSGYSWTNLQGLPGTALLKKMFSPVNETSVDVRTGSSLSSVPTNMRRRHLKNVDAKSSAVIGINTVSADAVFLGSNIQTIDNDTTMSFRASNSTNSR